MNELPPEDPDSPDEMMNYVFDLQEALAYVRAALGLTNDFPTYTRERGQEVLDAIDREIRNSPDDLSPEELREYFLERFTEHIPHDKRVQIFSDPKAIDAFLSLFENAPALVAQVNALYFPD
ncbi:MAG: hypothetical protein KDI65_07650 [Alphaproteobacteria bacterium]|nr:hypothetical protein [Alphaproteobacteria bacterium]